MQIVFIDQQDYIGDTLIKSCLFFDSKIQNQLIELKNIDNLLLDGIKVKDIYLYSNIQSSIILLNQCNKVLVTNSIFKNNTNSQGFGGSIYAIDNTIIQINNTRFYQNKCLKQKGGAISIQNKITPGNLVIFQSEFINNEAYYSTGGAINLYNSNMVLQNSTLSSNKAQIGGAIYYEQIIPDFILEFQKGKNLNNIISQNYAKIYGKNFGSTLRRELQSKQFGDSGFELNGQIMFKPENSMTLEIVSNNFPQLMDSNGNNYLQQGQLKQNIKIYFDKCSQGQITKLQSNSTICEDCPEGKYSLNIHDTVCSQCPDSAIKCYKSTILLKNGYWRENIQTDQILYCSFNPSSCLPESKNSKKVIEAHFAILVILMENYGENNIQKSLVLGNAMNVKTVQLLLLQKIY
ncbi:transmembrane protein (macronuclear) [Tetrahymena thermophila SB210]|uniref:Transmembrane protein n=1 Tax=Tetrahymena thermophila (strain SB210) TaxID=312017 RepID=Q23MJ5_TETTS|nr:transmembrane protein [Tetrahymena thermophila SB210]EAR97771.1 transmembrane protein [Tetrahymena thermophila SB210]|eukprot:XP_001018016.1 transmembrane protein [Tetrahymena thermophila SB210]